MVGIKLKLSAVESHDSVGSGECYHAPLRLLYNKIHFSSPNLGIQFCFRLALKAMNNNMNPEGLVPSLLVFGVLSRFPVVNTQLPTQVDGWGHWKWREQRWKASPLSLKFERLWTPISQLPQLRFTKQGTKFLFFGIRTQ